MITLQEAILASSMKVVLLTGGFFMPSLNSNSAHQRIDSSCAEDPVSTLRTLNPVLRRKLRKEHERARGELLELDLLQLLVERLDVLQGSLQVAKPHRRDFLLQRKPRSVA